jgi:hypothetical protein
MSSFEAVLAQYEKQKEQTQLAVLIEIAAQLKRIADAMENKDIDGGNYDDELPF